MRTLCLLKREVGRNIALEGETSVLRIRSYTTAVYGRITSYVIACGRTRLLQLYNLMNNKLFYLFYFILFILGHLDGLN